MPSSSSGRTGPARRPRHSWRRWNNILHRDLGYLAVGLTVIYAVSGVAVNHIGDWNPSYRFVREEQRFTPLPVTDKQALVQQLVDVLDLPGMPTESFRSAPQRVQLFYDGWSVDADVTAGLATVERPTERPLLAAFNRLHLNQAGRAWTFAADAYAIILAFLAISGTLILKGKKGITGRGKWLISAGLLVPILGLLLAGWAG